MKQQILPPRAGGLRLSANFRLTLFVLALAGALAWMTPASATDRAWTGAVSANWSEPNNWNPSGAPQNGDLLEFDEADFGDTSHRAMLNDLSGLTCALDFNDVHGDFTLSGNTLDVSSFHAAPAAALDFGVTRMLTINCPLVFANGGTIQVGTDTGPAFSGEDKSLLYLNGGIAVQNGTLTIQAVADSGRSGHAYIAGALSGAGDVKVEADEKSGTAGSIEFDSQSDSTNYAATLWLSTVGNTQITFNQTSGVMVSRHVGVHNGDTANLQLNQSDQSRTRLWIDPGCSLLLGGNNATFLGVVMVANSNELSAPYLGDGVLLGINGNGIDVHCDDNNHTPDIAGRLNFNGLNPITVYGAATVGLEIPANIEGDGFYKTGNSTLILNGLNNTFTGTAAVDAGILDVQSSGALGSAGAETLLNGGLLVLRASISGVTLTARSESTNADNPDLPGATIEAISPNPVTWDGPVVLNTNLDVFGDDITFPGQISGVGGLGFFNLGTAQLTGNSTNTFAGEMLVRCPLLELNKPANVYAFSGWPLIVGGGFGGPYEVRWLQSNQSDGTEVDVYANGRVNLNNHNDGFAPLVFNGGEVDTGSGVLACHRVETVANSATAVINGDLDMGFDGGVAFDVADGAAEPDLLVNAVVSGWGGYSGYVSKDGAGAMALAGANTFTSDTVVWDGTLEVENPSALGAVVNSCGIADGATLELNVSGSIANNLQTAGGGAGGANGAIEAAAGSSATLSGSIQLAAASTFNVASGAALGLSGAVSGTGPLTKTGAGPLTLAGSSPNTFSGDLTNLSGLLYLSKSGGAVAVPGNLTLGPAPANAAAMAILLSPNSIGGDTVTVNANSSLNLNGRNQTLSQLNLNDGGSAQTGAGTLLLTGGANVNVGSLRTGIGGGSHVSASITGNIGLPPNSASVNFNVSPYAFFFPFDSRPELDVPAAIFINGYEDPNQAQTGISKNGSGRMRLGGSGTFLGAGSVNGGTLQVDGSLSASGVVVVGDGTLKGTGSVGRVIMNSASATLAPGDSPGILTCYNFDAIGSGFSGVLNVELNGATPGSGYSQLVSGPVNLNGISLNATLGYQPNTNDQFVIIQNNATGPYGSVTGTFNGLPEGASVAVGTQVFQVTYHGGDGNDVVLTDIGKLVIPELNIERAGTKLVRLLWATNALSFGLQSATNLPATNWNSVSPLPVVVGTNNVVTNTVDGAEKFYRLRNP